MYFGQITYTHTHLPVGVGFNGQRHPTHRLPRTTHTTHTGEPNTKRLGVCVCVRECRTVTRASGGGGSVINIIPGLHSRITSLRRTIGLNVCVFIDRLLARVRTKNGAEISAGGWRKNDAEHRSTLRSMHSHAAIRKASIRGQVHDQKGCACACESNMRLRRALP